MIFGFLVKALKFIVDGFASVCAFLLVTLGLWLPAVYSLLFLVICAIAGIKLQGGAITLYIVGLVLTFLGGVAIAYLRRKSKKKPEKSSRRNVRSVQKSEYAPREPERRTDYVREDRYEPIATAEPEPVAPELAPEPENISKSAASTAKDELYGKNDCKYEDFSDLRKKYFGDENAKDEIPPRPESGFVPNSGDGEFVPPANPDALMRDQLERRLMGTYSEETPMIFATRRDPNIIVYEYSDRLKFFRKTKRGLVHISTEFKK